MQIIHENRNMLFMQIINATQFVNSDTIKNITCAL